MPRSFFEYLLSGVVDYSIWFGSPGNYETNLVMVEAKKTRSLDEGMLSFLGYMGNDLELHLTNMNKRIC